jgi:hypothetical protein
MPTGVVDMKRYRTYLKYLVLSVYLPSLIGEPIHPYALQ